MSKYNYSELEKQINDVLYAQDEALKSIKPTNLEETNKNISDSEALLMRLGYGDKLKEIKNQKPIAKPKKVIVVPTWEELCLETQSQLKEHHDLEELFNDEELKENKEYIHILNAEYKQIHHLDKVELATSIVGGILGAMIDILLVGIPKQTPNGVKAGPLSNYIRDLFDKKYGEDAIKELEEKAEVTFDASTNQFTNEEVKGLCPQLHRLYSLGHDPILGFIIGVKDTLCGTFTTIDKTGKILVQKAHDHYIFNQESNIITALIKQIHHLQSDVNTSAGLPAPFMGLFELLQFGKINFEDEELNIAATIRKMYQNGYDFRHFTSMSIPVLANELFVRTTYIHHQRVLGKNVNYLNMFTTNRDKNPKLTTMLFISSLIASLLNAGKVYFTNANPMAINWPQWLALIKYGYKQLKWNLKDKPLKQEAYVNNILNDNLNDIVEDINNTFDDATSEYIVAID